MRVCSNTLATLSNSSKYLVRAHFSLAARTLNSWLSLLNLTLFFYYHPSADLFYQLFWSHRKFVIIALKKKKTGTTLKIRLYFITVFEAIKNHLLLFMHHHASS